MDPRGPFLHSKVLLPDLREQLDRLLTPRSDVELRDSVSPRGLPWPDHFCLPRVVLL